MIKKILLTEEGRHFYVRDISKDFHTQYGIVKKEDFAKGTAITNTGKAMSVIGPSFTDLYRKIKRGPQIVARKDIGLIIAETGVNKKSIVIDAGAGSGALCCALANICKKVTSYELREDFFKIAKDNAESLGLSNLTIKNKDVYSGIDEKNADLVTLDLPEPWKAIGHAAKALKAGGFLVSYSPTIPQVMDFVQNLGNQFIHLKTVEILMREWEFLDRKVRPKSQMTGHTGFLSFCRKA